MPSDQSLWYKIGYALERTRQTPDRSRQVLAGLAERTRAGKAAEKAKPRFPAPERWPTADDLVAAGAVALAGRLLRAWKPRARPGVVGLARAAAAGAAAALLVEWVRPLLGGTTRGEGNDPELVERMLAGAGQGLLYGGVVEPRVPGPAVLRGALYGSAEFALDPLGGLTRTMGKHGPLGRFPVAVHLLEDLRGHPRTYLEHVLFGISLALLYGTTEERSGIRVELRDEG